MASLLAAERGLTAARKAQMLVEARRTTAAERGGRRPWRLTVPMVLDYEHAMVDEIVAAKPDLIHAHDVQLVSVADKAASLASAPGNRVPWIYDAHEFVAGLSLYRHRTAGERAGWLDLEATFVPRAQQIITVSQALADELGRRYRTQRPPVVVVNAPWKQDVRRSGGIRDQLGLGSDTPLLVYSGGVTHARGVHTAVEALQHLPGVHLAVAAVPPGGWYLRGLQARAAALGVGDRLHVTVPARPDAVVQNLASADVGLIPLLRFPSHDLALTNKLFEYIHAGLPVVVSDCPEQARFVRETGIGQVHAADDAEGLARAARAVLDRRGHYRRAIAAADVASEYSWQRAEGMLVGVYRQLFDGRVSRPDATTFPVLRERPVRKATVPTSLRILGGGAAAVELATTMRAVGGMNCEVVARPAEALVATEDTTQVLGPASHILIADAQAVATARRQSPVDEAEFLRGAGYEVALLLDGEVAVNPASRGRRYRWSWAHEADESRQQRFDGLVASLSAFDGPIFATTLDAADDVPGAIWLPTVVSVPDTRSDVLRAERPVVVSLGTTTVTPAWRAVDRALRAQADAGTISYQPLLGAAPVEVLDALPYADVVVDDLSRDTYGVAAIRAMATGRLVVGHVADAYRTRLPGDVPVLHATPDTFDEVIRTLLSDRSAGRAVAARGPTFAATVHDGRWAARILSGFLTGSIDDHSSPPFP